MNVSRFEPWGLLNLLHRDLDQLAGRRLELGDREGQGSSVADWVPAVDIVEQKDRYVLRAEVPGVRPEDIDVHMENGVLTLSGERFQESSDEDQGMRRIERISGKFYRRFNLPETADADEISARRIRLIPALSLRRSTVLRHLSLMPEACAQARRGT